MKDNSFKLPGLTPKKSLKSMVENRVIYTLNHCEFNLFETYQIAEKVALKFHDMVVTTMLRGKKRMHLFDNEPFDYLPGETVVLPPNEKMIIDFPEASDNQPAQCTALSIDKSRIDKTLLFLNEHYPRLDTKEEWHLDYSKFHFKNDQILSITNKLITECMSDSVHKDIFVDLTLQELLIRIIQEQNLSRIESDAGLNSNNGVIQSLFIYIRENISNDLDIEELSKNARMSASSLYRLFKTELGISPKEFVMNEKIKQAKKLLRRKDLQIKQICYELGYSDSSYFTRVFKKQEGTTPMEYRASLL